MLVAVEVTEKARDGAQLADPSRSDQLARSKPLRMRADHESLADFHRRAVPRRQKRPRFLSAQAERLLAQNVLARFYSLEGPGHVKLIGKRIVNGFDFRIEQELFIRSVGFRNAERARRLFGLLEVARGDCANLAPLPFLHRRYHFSNSNLGRTQNTPSNLVPHRRASFLLASIGRFVD